MLKGTWIMNALNMTTIVSARAIGIQISEKLARKHAKCAKVKNLKW